MSAPITRLVDYLTGKEQTSHLVALPLLLQELFSESVSSQEQLDHIVDLYEDRIFLETLFEQPGVTEVRESLLT